MALDIFTGEKYEDLCPTSHNVDCPFTKRTEYPFLSADADTGEVSLLNESGDGTKGDLNLPTFIQQGEPTDEDKKVTEDILRFAERGDEFLVAVLSACGMEKIVGAKKVQR